MVIMNKLIKQIKKVIYRANNIAIFSHVSPDFDALGSSFALQYFLKSINKNAKFFCNDDLTLKEKMLFDEHSIGKTFKIEDFDLVISVDTPSIQMLGIYGEDFMKSANRIVIDHHQNIDLNGQVTLVDTTFSSCCEIVFKILKSFRKPLSKEVVSALYAGLSTDTNSFVNTNTTVNSFMTAYELMNLGADVVKINETIYRTKTLKEIDFKKYVLSNMVIKDDIAYCLMPKKQLDKMHGTKSDCSGISSDLVAYQGVNIAFSIVEEENSVFKVSFRSKYGYDVRKIANFIGGGGHIGASGATLKGDNIDQIKDKVLDAIDKNR